jgi:hypothetical protein
LSTYIKRVKLLVRLIVLLTILLLDIARVLEAVLLGFLRARLVGGDATFLVAGVDARRHELPLLDDLAHLARHGSANLVVDEVLDLNTKREVLVTKLKIERLKTNLLGLSTLFEGANLLGLHATHFLGGDEGHDLGQVLAGFIHLPDALGHVEGAWSLLTFLLVAALASGGLGLAVGWLLRSAVSGVAVVARRAGALLVAVLVGVAAGVSVALVSVIAVKVHDGAAGLVEHLDGLGGAFGILQADAFVTIAGVHVQLVDGVAHLLVARLALLDHKGDLRNGYDKEI